MRIIGHGIDIQDMKRVEKLLSNPNNDWLDGAFTAMEQAAAAEHGPPNSVQYYAGRYAAKEAIAKALGTGFSEDVTWLDVEIRRGPFGNPEINLTGGAAELAQRLAIDRWLLSISHSGEYALASVMGVSDK